MILIIINEIRAIRNSYMMNINFGLNFNFEVLSLFKDIFYNTFYQFF